MTLRLLSLVLLFSLASPLRAEDGVITPDELKLPPTPARVSFLVSHAAMQGWTGWVPGLRQAAMTAYEAKLSSAPAWFYLYRWAAFLAQPEDQAMGQWMKVVNAFHLGYPAVQPSGNHELAARCSREFQQFALGSYAFSDEFFSTLQPVDCPPAVLNILQRIYASNPARFADYQNLAIAIAVVYDVPPPAVWPHRQVSPAALPRKLPAPQDAFQYWVNLDLANATLQHLRSLPAGELKFVVDEVESFPQLDAARKNLPFGLADLGKAYDLVRFRQDRLDAKMYQWSKPDYQLTTILQEGGIGVDQAYFAAVFGKSKGVPTLIFLSKGLDGRHAWFGYLDGQQKWQLDIGRFSQKQLVTGVAYDPQTWALFPSYELQFLSDRFRALPAYRLSLVNADFAEEYLREGKAPEALNAARESVNRERRNLDGWSVLMRSQLAISNDPVVIEGILREAVQAFQKYPDLKQAFALQLAQSMRARGQGSAAEAEQKQVTPAPKASQTNQREAASSQAADIMERSMREDQLPEQVRLYQQVLEKFGQGAGYEFYYRVVEPFATHLQQQQQIPSALSAVDRARKYLRVDKGGELDNALTALSDRLKSGEN